MQRHRFLFSLTGILQICIGLGAIPSGIGFIIDPYGGNFRLTYELIIDTPFQTYLVPGIFLFLVIGLGSIGGATLSMTKHPLSGQAAVILGAALLVWMFCQFYWVGILSWVQFTYLVFGITEVILGFMLVHYLHVPKRWPYLR